MPGFHRLFTSGGSACNRRIPQCLAKIFLDLFVRDPLDGPAAGPGPRIRARIVYRHLVLQRVEIRPRETRSVKCRASVCGSPPFANQNFSLKPTDVDHRAYLSPNGPPNCRSTCRTSSLRLALLASISMIWSRQLRSPPPASTRIRPSSALFDELKPVGRPTLSAGPPGGLSNAATDRLSTGCAGEYSCDGFRPGLEGRNRDPASAMLRRIASVVHVETRALLAPRSSPPDRWRWHRPNSLSVPGAEPQPRLAIGPSGRRSVGRRRALF